MNDIFERRIDFASPGGVEQFSIVELPDHIEVTAYHTWDIENVVIPSEIDGKAVTAIDGGNCFFMHKEIKAVVMPDTIQRIRDDGNQRAYPPGFGCRNRSSCVPGLSCIEKGCVAA